MRTLLYVSAQLSGAISGTATVLGFYGRGRGAAVRAASLADLGPEFLLAFLAALVFFNAVTYSSPLHAAVIIGIIFFSVMVIHILSILDNSANLFRVEHFIFFSICLSVNVGFHPTYFLQSKFILLHSATRPASLLLFEKGTEAHVPSSVVRHSLLLIIGSLNNGKVSVNLPNLI